MTLIHILKYTLTAKKENIGRYGIVGGYDLTLSLSIKPQYSNSDQLSAKI